MYTCPDPTTIVEGLFDIYALFKDMDDPMMAGDQTRKVLVPNALKILETEMWYVQRGLLSDIPGMQMYFTTRKLPTTGFQMHRCVRGTSGLEGMHLHYRASQHPCAKGSGVFAMNVRGKLFIWDWNVTAAVRAGGAHAGSRPHRWVARGSDHRRAAWSARRLPAAVPARVGADANGQGPAYHDRRPVRRARDHRQAAAAFAEQPLANRHGREARSIG